jgi:hypothetical protein
MSAPILEQLACFEAVLSRLVTALQGESCSGAEIESLSACYAEAEVELDQVLSGLSALPINAKPAVLRIVRLRGLAKHLLASELEATTLSISKVRGSRRALGSQTNSEYVGMGATAVDCDMQG